MQFCVPLLLFFAVSWQSGVLADDWTPMKVMTVAKGGLLPDQIQKSLQGALKWFELAVRVDKTQSPVTLQTVQSGIPSYSGGNLDVTVQSPSKTFSLKMEKLQPYLEIAHLTIFVEIETDAECNSNPGLLASVSPMFRGNGRPQIAIMHYCRRQYSPKFNYFDLFRHEILHGLGFGTLQTSPPADQKYPWVFADGTSQTATRRFLGFGGLAVEEIKKHFGCQQGVDGVEADDERQHLNEYIFGDELMTPILEKDGPNYFSYISASILENIHKGNQKWYKVDREFIAPEAEAYTFRKNFGCEFLLKSCFEFISAKKGKMDLFPFCTGSAQEAQTCFKNPNDPLMEYGYECDNYNKENGAKADNGITEPSNSKYHSSKNRFCPILQSALFKMTKAPCSTNY